MERVKNEKREKEYYTKIKYAYQTVKVKEESHLPLFEVKSRKSL